MGKTGVEKGRQQTPALLKVGVGEREAEDKGASNEARVGKVNVKDEGQQALALLEERVGDISGKAVPVHQHGPRWTLLPRRRSMGRAARPLLNLG